MFVNGFKIQDTFNFLMKHISHDNDVFDYIFRNYIKIYQL